MIYSAKNFNNVYTENIVNNINNGIKPHVYRMKEDIYKRYFDGLPCLLNGNDNEIYYVIVFIDANDDKYNDIIARFPTIIPVKRNPDYYIDDFMANFKFLDESFANSLAYDADAYISIIIPCDQFVNEEELTDFKQNCKGRFGRKSIKDYGAGVLELIITESEYPKFAILAEDFNVSFEIENHIEY